MVLSNFENIGDKICFFICINIINFKFILSKLNKYFHI